jgi:hypothetical protein
MKKLPKKRCCRLGMYLHIASMGERSEEGDFSEAINRGRQLGKLNWKLQEKLLKVDLQKSSQDFEGSPITFDNSDEGFNLGYSCFHNFKLQTAEHQTSTVVSHNKFQLNFSLSLHNNRHPTPITSTFTINRKNTIQFSSLAVSLPLNQSTRVCFPQRNASDVCGIFHE